MFRSNVIGKYSIIIVFYVHSFIEICGIVWNQYTWNQRCQSKAAWGNSPGNYKELNTYIPPKIAPNLHTSTSEGSVQQSIRRQRAFRTCDREERKKQSQAPGKAAAAQSSQLGEGEGTTTYDVFVAVRSPEQSCLRDKHIPHSRAGQRAGQRLSAEGWQLCLSNRLCQVESWVMEPGCIPPPNQSAPSPLPLTLPAQALSHRGYCAARNETYTAATPRIRGGVIDTKHLKPESHHYWKKNSYEAGLCQFTNSSPVRLIHKEAGEHCTWQLEQYWGSDSHHPSHSPTGTLGPRQPDHRGDTHLSREKRVFLTSNQKPSRFWQCRSLGRHLLEIKRKISYQLAKELSVINLVY